MVGISLLLNQTDIEFLLQKGEVRVKYYFASKSLKLQTYLLTTDRTAIACAKKKFLTFFLCAKKCANFFFVCWDFFVPKKNMCQ